MLSLHTGIFARMFTVLAVIGLVMGGVSVGAMPQMQMASTSNGVQSIRMSDIAGADHHHAEGMAQQENACTAAADMPADCSTANADDHCKSAGECCPHCVTALPAQIESNFASLPTVQTATPQWRVSSVTPVTEIRPPIFIS